MPKQAYQRFFLSAAAAIALAVPSFADGIAGPYLAARQAGISSDYKEAANYSLRAMEARPQNLRLKENAVLSLIAAGDMDLAIPVAREHKAAGGRNPLIELVLKADAVKSGDFTTAAEGTAEQSGLAPLVDGLLQGWAGMGNGDMSDAITAFEKVAETQDFASFARYHQALALALAGDFETANGIFSGETFGPLVLSARGIAAHAQVLSQLERNDDALELLRATTANGLIPDLTALINRLEVGETLPFDVIRDAKDGVAEVYFNLASALNGQASGDHVLLYSRLATYLRPDHVPATLLVAENLEALNQYELATVAYAAVQPDSPSYFVAEMGRADALYAADKTEAAAEVLTTLSRSHTEIPIVHAALGDMLSRLRRDDEAIAAYSRAIEMRGPDDPVGWGVYYARGIVHERQKDFDEMERDFRKALELSPDHPDVLNYLGYSLVEQRTKLDEALEMIEKAVALRPESGYITDSLGWVFYRLGRFEDAVAPMERAVELLPVDPIVNDHLGDVYYKVGRVREAEFQWKRALSFDPTEEEADRIRRKLEVGLTKVLAEEAAAEETQTAND